jgi:hypothetical protein
MIAFVRLSGALGISPEAAAFTVAHLKQAAQDFECGADVTGQPGWRHDRVTAGP